MISLIEAKNFRSIKYISRPLSRFHVLIGGNATGKTTFFDVVGFIADIINAKDIDEAIDKRLGGYGNFEDLTHKGEGGDIQFAIELVLPKQIKTKIWNPKIDTIRYEIQLGKIDGQANQYGIKEERVFLFTKPLQAVQEITLFPDNHDNAPKTLFFKTKTLIESYRQTIHKSTKGKDSYYDEISEQAGKGWNQSFMIGVKRSALAYMMPDEHKYPATAWLRAYLSQSIQLFMLDSLEMRMPSSPNKGIHFKPDGSNLPWVIDELRNKDEERFEDWLAHVRTALPDIEDIKIIEIPHNRYKHLSIKYIYHDNLVPSWLVSDGTLRLLALTLPAYLPTFSGLFLIEEPENGIHPQAIETVYQALSGIRHAQVLLATHSPIILGLSEPKDLLCFSKTKEGVTDIVLGSQHPMLKDWKKGTNIKDFYAAGILG